MNELVLEAGSDRTRLHLACAEGRNALENLERTLETARQSATQRAELLFEAFLAERRGAWERKQDLLIKRLHGRLQALEQRQKARATRIQTQLEEEEEERQLALMRETAIAEAQLSTRV